MTHQEFVEKVMGLCRGEYDQSLAGSVALELIAHDKKNNEEIEICRKGLLDGILWAAKINDQLCHY